jgi:hypothetical protein
VDVGLTSGLDAIPAERLRSGVWLGAGVSAGRLQLDSAQAVVQGRVDVMPMVLLGADLWTSEEYGFLVRGSFGLNAQLTLPPVYGEQSLAYRQHHVLMGALRRWHLSDAPDAITLSAGLGLRAQVDETPPQRPTYLVDRAALGPAALLGVMVPVSGALWLNGRASASTHVLVREDPADSGALDSSLALEAALEVCARVSEALSVVVDVEWRRDQVSFVGFGTRAVGVYDAQTDQIFWTAGAALRVGIQ